MTREQKLEEALRRLTNMRKGIEADVLSAHSNRGNGASNWMREDDWDFRRELREAFDAAHAALTAGEEAGGNPVGEAENMPGTDGFTMACFKAIDVPAGTKLYTHSTPSPIVDDAMVDRARADIRMHLGYEWTVREDVLRVVLNAALSGAREGGE